MHQRWYIETFQLIQTQGKVEGQIVMEELSWHQNLRGRSTITIYRKIMDEHSSQLLHYDSR